MARALLALGSNLGDRAATLRAALGQLGAEAGLKLLRASQFYETAPAGGPADQASYLNAAAIVETHLPPAELWARLQQIEQQFGRRRDVRWGPRTLDLDLLLFDELSVSSPQLEIPHPRMAVRRFVLEPAAEIAPDWVHPRTGWTVGRLLDHLESASPYVAITGPPGVGKTELAHWLGARGGSDVVTLSAEALAHASRAGSPPAVELEFVRARARLLKGVARKTGGSWLISDFWLEQSLAYATEAEREAVEKEIERQLTSVVTPKLTVVVEPKFSAGTPAAERTTRALQELVSRPHVGPVLCLRGPDLAATSLELAAALDSMR
ncbi:MAG: 2-amino-4-hydroxy-6-hydroxymethyldihydropteridine diphosphokinase [Planctomycetaceae bacterium]|nr:2-amino-4-hydroxy-6-hydroxymethyldihydropteridine diphosphokinase [Planctomycetaceae bacterium]